jgi:hypothetical protein
MKNGHNSKRCGQRIFISFGHGNFHRLIPKIVAPRVPATPPPIPPVLPETKQAKSFAFVPHCVERQMCHPGLCLMFAVKFRIACNILSSKIVFTKSGMSIASVMESWAIVQLSSETNGSTSYRLQELSTDMGVIFGRNVLFGDAFWRSRALCDPLEAARHAIFDGEFWIRQLSEPEGRGYYFTKEISASNKLDPIFMVSNIRDKSSRVLSKLVFHVTSETSPASPSTVNRTLDFRAADGGDKIRRGHAISNNSGAYWDFTDYLESVRSLPCLFTNIFADFRASQFSPWTEERYSIAITFCNIKLNTDTPPVDFKYESWGNGFGDEKLENKIFVHDFAVVCTNSHFQENSVVAWDFDEQFKYFVSYWARLRTVRNLFNELTVRNSICSLSDIGHHKSVEATGVPYIENKGNVASVAVLVMDDDLTGIGKVGYRVNRGRFPILKPNSGERHRLVVALTAEDKFVGKTEMSGLNKEGAIAVPDYFEISSTHDTGLIEHRLRNSNRRNRIILDNISGLLLGSQPAYNSKDGLRPLN